MFKGEAIYSMYLIIFIIQIALGLFYLKFLRENSKSKLLKQICSDSEFLNIINNIPIPIFFRDKAGRLLAANLKYFEELNVERINVIGKTILECDVLSVKDAKLMHGEYISLMSENRATAGDMLIERKSKKKYSVFQFLSPLNCSSVGIVGLVGGWVDMTTKENLLENLILEKQKSDDANHAKSIYLTTMSHEIRTPLNAIIGILELALTRADQDGIEKSSLRVAVDAARHLVDVVGDVLDIAKIEAGKLDIKPESSNVRQLIESVIRIFEESAEQKNIKLAVRFDLAYQGNVLLDPVRFKQIIFNIVSNSIKFTHNGGVHITVTTRQNLENDSVTLQVFLKDSGIGISEYDQTLLFKPYTQAKDTIQSVRNSSGLGLFICKTLCELMGGKLKLNSRIGIGTKVHISIPLQKMSSVLLFDDNYIRQPRSIGALRILVVDDYFANRMLVTQQLTHLGHSVVSAEDGHTGFSLWLNNSFDVVITDCNMPNMSGYDLARAILTQRESRSLCVIIGLTANATSEEREKCLASGMTDCLFKPVSIIELNACLNFNARTVNLPKESGRTNHQRSHHYYINLLNLTHNDAVVAERLLHELHLSNEDEIFKLEELLAMNDTVKFFEVAHRVKGSAKIIQASYLVAACEEVEAACLHHNSIFILECVKRLDLAMKELSEELISLINQLR